MDLWQWHCRNRREQNNLLQLVCGNVIAEIGGICGNCGNAIAENGMKINNDCQNLGRN